MDDHTWQTVVGGAAEATAGAEATAALERLLYYGAEIDTCSEQIEQHTRYFPFQKTLARCAHTHTHTFQHRKQIFNK